MCPSETSCSRRDFLSLAVAAPVISSQNPTATKPPVTTPDAIHNMNYRKLLARADLVYGRPPARSEEGIPVGNGRMGSLVWTTPGTLKFQINRVDVYGNDSYTNSFFERHNDYCGGCGFVDLEFGDLGEEVFPAAGFAQRLSVYDGLLELSGKAVTARVLAWPEKDVMAVQIADLRQARSRSRSICACSDFSI